MKNRVGELFPLMKDHELKQSILKPDAWKILSDDLKVDLILNRMNKTLSRTFSECINSLEADDLAGKLLFTLSAETTEKHCNSIGLFLLTVSEKLSKSVLLEIIEKLGKIKAGRKIIKQIKEDPVISDIITDYENEKVYSVPGQKVLENLTSENRTIDSIENKFWEKYALSIYDLPVITDSFGKEVEPFVLEYLLQ